MRLARSQVVTQIFEAQWGEFPIMAGLRPLITVNARDVEEFGFAPAIQKFSGSSLKQRVGFRHQARPLRSGKAHLCWSISLPPALATKVSCPHKAGRMASYAPGSMKPAPETAFQLTKSGGLAAADDVGASDHVHCFPFWIGAERATNEKGALRRLCWVAGESPG